ncbi:MAG: hypothetical protein K2G45_11410 [Lachnospiraceae bacterium]|nr:hypothetical protein [Lachnospiraceae bacterium]
MSFKNVFYVSLKRIFARKIYIFTLSILILLTSIYKFLPIASRSSDINVAVYINGNDKYTVALTDKMENATSVYKFYIAEDENQLISDVKSGKAECGFVVPSGFADSYITGNVKEKITLYTVPGTTLSYTITETFLSYIYNMCATDILLHAADTPMLNDALKTAITQYMNSDEIFRIEDISTGNYISNVYTYPINLPVYEVALCLIIFTGLLGLLTYLNDSERDIFIALPSASKGLILMADVTASILPIYLLSVFCCFITYKSHIYVINIAICSLITASAAILLKPVIRKSTILSKVLPIIMLFSIVLIFAASFMP